VDLSAETVRSGRRQIATKYPRSSNKETGSPRSGGERVSIPWTRRPLGGAAFGGTIRGNPSLNSRRVLDPLGASKFCPIENK
jgi:hypothetical protein